MKPELPAFWLTNFSNRNVSLTDLNLTVKAFSSVNLLDHKHYYYTIDQLVKSATEGSIFKKRRMLRVRQITPIITKMDMPFLRETFIPSREHSILTIEEANYEELKVSDDFNKENEEFAKENADIAASDLQPMFIKKEGI
jgi:hypothetical protein